MRPLLGPDHRHALARLPRFAAAGLLAAAIYCVLVGTLVELLSVGVLFANSLAFIVVAVLNYMLHYHWTFESTARHAFAFPSFVSMNVVGFALNWVIVCVGTKALHANYLVVQAVAVVGIVTWNFLASWLWIFGRGRLR